MTSQQPSHDRVALIINWANQNQRMLIGVLAVLVLAAGGVWFAISAKQRREAFAVRALQSARAAMEAGNLPLAASDLSRLVQSYGGTPAADEATILLAQVRLSQGDAETAVAELQAALSGRLGEQFRAAAHGLLGGAYEQQGRMDEAGNAYLRAADLAWYDFLAAQYLTDAGRAFTAGGDTAQAASAYERLLAEHAKSPAATEARIRLAELRPSAPPSGK